MVHISRSKVSIVTSLALSLVLGSVGLGGMEVGVGYVNIDGVLALADASQAAVDPACFSECYGDCFHECIQTAPKSWCITECNQLYNECVAECPASPPPECVPTWVCRQDERSKDPKCQICTIDYCDGTGATRHTC
jgi:hypothetical protein